MKVKDLIEILEGLKEDEEILFLPENSSYQEDFSDETRRNVGIRSFWGKDYKATILISGEQVGGMDD